MKHAWALAAVVMLAGMLVGCPEYRIIWAPDGTKALVAGKDQLYLCDADGKLQPLAAVPRGPMAWTADSRQFVIRREIPVKNWEELAAGLPADQLAYLKRMSEDWMDHLRKTPDARVYRGRLGALMALYLSAHHNEDITRIAQGDWRGKQKVSSTVGETFCLHFRGPETRHDADLPIRHSDHQGQTRAGRQVARLYRRFRIPPRNFVEALRGIAAERKRAHAAGIGGRRVRLAPVQAIVVACGVPARRRRRDDPVVRARFDATCHSASRRPARGKPCGKDAESCDV